MCGGQRIEEEGREVMCMGYRHAVGVIKNKKSGGRIGKEGLMPFIHTLGSLHARPQGIMVNFNVVSIFTRALIREAMSLLAQHFDDILLLFCHVLTLYVSTGDHFDRMRAWLQLQHCLRLLPTSS